VCHAPDRTRRTRPLRRDASATYRLEDPLAYALEQIGDRWTLLIVRELLAGRTRFEELCDRLGIARNILARRLQRLTADGLLIREPVVGDRRAHAYRPAVCAAQLAAVTTALEDFHRVAAAERASSENNDETEDR
jgi:DNA-binding HxlR family transcriptional regulator